MIGVAVCIEGTLNYSGTSTSSAFFAQVSLNNEASADCCPEAPPISPDREPQLDWSVTYKSQHGQSRIFLDPSAGLGKNLCKFSRRFVGLGTRGRRCGRSVFLVIVPVDLQFFLAVKDRIAAGHSEIIPSPLQEGFDLGARGT